jgi:glyoxylase-like metal-dependent hydrolase (beta-lactamase superfamily II)
MTRLNLRTFVLGEWQTNCYVAHAVDDEPAGQRTDEREDEPHEEPRPCWIFDAGFNPSPMIRYIRQKHLTPQAVLLTHAHLDHIAGLPELRTHWPDLPILIHREEADFLTDPTLNLSIFLEEPLAAPAATGFLEHGRTLDIAGQRCELRHTPGHSPGGVTFHFPRERLAIVGDTLFAGSIGRYDFPTSDGELLLRSIREQLLTLPDDTRILPGHGPQTTIAAERRANPFLQ